MTRIGELTDEPCAYRGVVLARPPHGLDAELGALELAHAYVVVLWPLLVRLHRRGMGEDARSEGGRGAQGAAGEEEVAGESRGRRPLRRAQDASRCCGCHFSPFLICP